METVRLVCAVVGQPDSLITVEVGRKALIAVVKFLIKKNAPSKIASDACQLQLFLAMKNGEWFAHDDPDAVALQAGERTHEIECIVARPSLESLAIVVQYFDENYLSDRSAVQILVLLPDPEDQPNEQGQTALIGWSSSKILEPPLDFDVMNPTLPIPAVTKMPFQLMSWTLEEFYEAVKHHQFFAHIKSNLTVDEAVVNVDKRDLADPSVLTDYEKSLVYVRVVSFTQSDNPPAEVKCTVSVLSPGLNDRVVFETSTVEGGDSAIWEPFDEIWFEVDEHETIQLNVYDVSGRSPSLIDSV
ncbi:hypothetical protein Poli38472_013631 [Pythium oligandrum]|uniref:Crinkler effector protein N-terminal domain-containing protein n=1 Tax=Pythium oligandrum TaxID=41045 RepID=A0A8K1FJX5_PYTOL|nr:hypothetical protein Poli38472_013631 [Pythium oligandrum]|eukprot:TMW61168.1 hypothetical protein Poli38472_013631 [Pythium oligandrum]